MTTVRRKLIEVSLPLEAINRESAREKSIRHGHPSTLHLWWARRPLAACRAVLFAQLVDDPSARPEEFPTDEAQEAERQRLFGIIERLVVWENVNDLGLLREAYAEILKSTNDSPPVILDPFAGGGSIRLEAQRLGLEAHASDLNPVAVLINKALIEVPPKWAGRPPVSPGAAGERLDWPRATGIAEDVRRYGQWMLDEAERRIGHLYPKAKLQDGSTANVIAWIWARTITCPNPACAVQMPLVRSWWLGKKRGKEAFVVPNVEIGTDGTPRVEFSIGHDPKAAPSKEKDGTITRSGATCVACGTAVPKAYVQAEGVGRRMSAKLMAVVAEGDRRRQYLAPSPEHSIAASVEAPEDVPDADLSTHPQYMGTPRYGLTTQSDLFTPRQLIALATFGDLVDEARSRVLDAARTTSLADDQLGLEAGGTGASAYADSVAMYLALSVTRIIDRNSGITSWDASTSKEQVRGVFARQAIPMTWDIGENNIFGSSSGSYSESLGWLTRALDSLPATREGFVEQADATTRSFSGALVSTDPPYYDNVPSADLADFFYGWLRPSLLGVFPQLFGTLQTPKGDELVADQHRLGGRQQAAAFFEQGFRRVFANVRKSANPDIPITVFYAFKQVDGAADATASTGWQTLLEGMLESGWEVTATWPMRTELANRIRGLDSNALASSIVLALRPRPESAETINRRSFVQVLNAELPQALRDLQQGSIAPVDMAQAAIGPGMAVFSRYARVLESDGSDMTVRTALALINQALDEVLAEQEGDFDAETRFAVKWFSQYGWNEAPSGEADVLTRAVNTTVSALERGGIFRAAAGKARLVAPAEMTDSWSPSDDKAISVWEVSVRLGHALLTEGQDQAASWMREAASRVDLDAVKELAYLMYSVCERKGWTESAILFNALGTSWGDIVGAARETPAAVSQQGALSFDDVD